MDSLLTDVEVTEPLQKKPDEKKSDVKFYILCLVLLIILSIMPIVAIIIGIHFRNECPINLFLPVCLIVLGVSSIGLVILFSLFILYIVKSSSSIDDENTTRTRKCVFRTIVCILSIIIAICIISILVANSIFLMIRRRIKAYLQFDNSTDTETYCHPVVYYSLATYTITILVMTVVCICIPRIVKLLILLLK
ncbi:unnamed protein product [Rotaria socialis]